MEKRSSNPTDRPAAREKPSGASPATTKAGGGHAVAAGAGAVAGLAAGAVVGSLAGPAGTLLGAAAGAAVGGLMTKGIADQVNPTVEDLYWRDNFQSRDYVAANASYDDYGPAYRYGAEAYLRRQGGRWEDAEPELGARWHEVRGESTLDWPRARIAARDAWQRLRAQLEQPASDAGDGSRR